MTYRKIGRNIFKLSNLRELIDNDVKNRNIVIPVGYMVKHNGKCMAFNGSDFRMGLNPRFAIYQLWDGEGMT